MIFCLNCTIDNKTRSMVLLLCMQAYLGSSMFLWRIIASNCCSANTVLLKVVHILWSVARYDLSVQKSIRIWCLLNQSVDIWRHEWKMHLFQAGVKSFLNGQEKTFTSLKNFLWIYRSDSCVTRNASHNIPTFVR